jgi:hypothetical protein
MVVFGWVTQKEFHVILYVCHLQSMQCLTTVSSCINNSTFRTHARIPRSEKSEPNFPKSLTQNFIVFLFFHFIPRNTFYVASDSTLPHSRQNNDKLAFSIKQESFMIVMPRLWLSGSRRRFERNWCLRLQSSSSNFRFPPCIMIVNHFY